MAVKYTNLFLNVPSGLRVVSASLRCLFLTPRRQQDDSVKKTHGSLSLGSPRRLHLDFANPDVPVSCRPHCASSLKAVWLGPAAPAISPNCCHAICYNDSRTPSCFIAKLCSLSLSVHLLLGTV